MDKFFEAKRSFLKTLNEAYVAPENRLRPLGYKIANYDWTERPSPLFDLRMALVDRAIPPRKLIDKALPYLKAAMDGETGSGLADIKQIMHDLKQLKKLAK